MLLLRRLEVGRHDPRNLVLRRGRFSDLRVHQVVGPYVHKSPSGIRTAWWLRCSARVCVLHVLQGPNLVGESAILR